MTRLKALVDERNACSIPWIHTEIDLQLNQIKPCCKYRGVIAPASQGLKSAWTNPAYQQLRSDIKNDLLHPACSACAVPVTVFSYRAFKNKNYYQRLGRIDIEQPLLPEVIHVTMKNTCNLACRMCYPVLSSKLNELTKKSSLLKDLYHYTEIDNSFNFDQLRGSFSNARHVTISGGEPLIDRDCVKLIELIRQESDLLNSITFSTNMTLHNDELIELLASMPVAVNFNLSLDGPVRIHEYIRVNSQWADIVTNLKKLSKYPKFGFGINSTISALNCGYIPELVDTIKSLQQETGIVFTHIMASPVLEEHLHPGVLPADIRSQYLDKLTGYAVQGLPGEQELVNAGIQLLNSTQGNTELFAKFIKEFDKLVNTSYTSVYPEWLTI